MNANTYSNRYEIKYLMESRRLLEVIDSIGDFLVRDSACAQNGAYYNYSIYFDSPEYRFYAEKREGELTRIKPRIRLYRSTEDGEPTAIYLELKGRYDRIVAKRRAPIDASLAQMLLSDGPLELDSNAIGFSAIAEFYYLAHRFRLQPCVTVLYHRTAYYGAFYPDVRITFDRVIRCSLGTELNNPGRSFTYAVPPNWLVIELKYNGKVPELLLRRFHALGLQQSTFSKYAVSLEKSYTCIERARADRWARRPAVSTAKPSVG